jgi:uncharacterized protein YjbJ (UPF0337 family)
LNGLKKTIGIARDKAGELLGDRHLENEGRAEKTEGHVRSGVGKAMDAVREVVEKEYQAPADQDQTPSGSRSARVFARPDV